MNSKLIKGSLAGVAALALAAGGTTFAAWSDWDVINGNKTEAGHLKIDLNSTGAINNVGGTAIAPGEFRTIDFMVASADLNGVPDAKLSMMLKNLADQENGCATTSSEQAVDNCHQGDPGEFSSQGYIRVRYTNPAPESDVTFGNNNCSAPSGYVNSAGYSPANDNTATHYPRLSGFAATGSHDLGTLEDGEAVCVRVDLGLDETADNKVQGDSSTFDVEFRLDQVI
jgi:predicted ribosomally synthesized peptide with SipW-like signal peptide